MIKKIINLLSLIKTIIIPSSYQHLLEKVFLKLIFPLYIGNNVTCPCCEKKLRKFIPYGNNINEICPICGSFARHRFLWLYLKDETDFFSLNLKVLHIAPERAFEKLFKSLSNIDYINADINSVLTMVKMDITSIAYEDNLFDVILCVHVLEHIENEIKALGELYRVLKPGGWAIIQVPIDPMRQKTFSDPKIISPKEKARAYGRRDHVRLYGLDYQNRLKKAGFKVKVINYSDELGLEKIKKYGLTKSRNIYFCIKQLCQ